jgi:hypothetical protein
MLTSATPQMSAYRLAQREPPECATSALQSLARAWVIPCGLRHALTHLGGSEHINTVLTECEALALYDPLLYALDRQYLGTSNSGRPFTYIR